MKNFQSFSLSCLFALFASHSLAQSPPYVEVQVLDSLEFAADQLEMTLMVLVSDSLASDSSTTLSPEVLSSWIRRHSVELVEKGSRLIDTGEGRQTLPFWVLRLEKNWTITKLPLACMGITMCS